MFCIFPDSSQLKTRMNVIVGSSRSAKLDLAFKNTHNVEVWSRPGGTYSTMKSLVDKHHIYHHGGADLLDFQTHIYIVAGLCDVTSKHKNYKENYSEITFDTTSEAAIIHVESSIRDLQTYILSYGYIPIFCTIVPSHIESQNLHNLSRRKTSLLKHTSEYRVMQDMAMTTFRHLNQFIPSLNNELGMTTPFLHRSVMQNTKKGKSYFQYKKLPDGCHASSKLNTSWAKEITHAITKNRS
jgi:hypothetical protein